MAKNFVQEGETITMIAPSGGVTSGVGVLIGTLFGVALETVAQTLPFELAVEGVFTMAKTAPLVISAGDIVYWVVATKALDKASAGVKEVGIAVKDAASAATTVDVRLTQVCRAGVTV